MSPLTHYFCRFGISADGYLLSRSDFCLTKMHNSLSSRRIYLTMYILEVTKQCVTFWFYKCQYWKFCSNFSAENQENFRFERRTVAINVTDIEDPDGWIKIDQLDVTCFIISLFTAQHVSNVSTSIFRSLRLIVVLFHVLYCSGSMCVGVTVWFGWGGVVSLCRLG